LVERWRLRKVIGVSTVTLARLVILLLAVLPFLPASAPRLGLLVTAQLLIAVLGSVAACAINSWFHQLLPAGSLGAFFGRRLIIASLLACASTLAVGYLIDHAPFGDVRFAYATAFVGAGLTGLLSSWCLARTPEPLMAPPQRSLTWQGMLREPLRDPNFRRLLIMLGGWNLASNISAPFLAVYLLQQRGYGLGTVTTLWVTSQFANAVALFLWGRLSDRLSNKAILAVALPVYFAGTVGLVFAGAVDRAELQLALLYALHVLMGAASGGIGLATGNMGLKLAPQGRATAYLAVIGLVSAFAGGAAPLLGGAIAQLLSHNELMVIMRWMSPARTNDTVVLGFAHWEFLFALSGGLGLYVMHALSRIAEGKEISERMVMQELALEVLRTVNHLSTIGGVIGGVFSFSRVSQWRREIRRDRDNRPG
jgi:hypothetical protein